MSQSNAIALNDPFAVELSFKVQSFDLDSRGLASEFAYLRWLESLRQEFLQQHFPHQADQYPVLVSTQIEYKQPVRSQRALTGRLWLSNLGKTRWALQIRLGSPEGTVAIATQTGHLVDAHTLTPLALPEALVQRYWDYQWRQSS
ncbi:MAG: acyl-CoA thioesterase [Cyanobacteria bacterium Co-bin13]|nr:acyl-CoA thioesterase [Cyanobacteria bacterium Co-bin13]